MSVEQRLRRAFSDYWASRRADPMRALECSTERLRAVSAAYVAGWTVEQVQQLDDAVRAGVCR